VRSVTRIRQLLALVACLAGGSGCLDARRVNADCRWTGDRAFPVNWTDATHRRHIVDDVRLAGENAVRFGDAVRTRVGLEGTVPRRDACLDTLYGKISLNHGVDRGRIDGAERTRTLGIDAALVWVPMAVLFLLGANLLSRRLLRVMPTPDERWPKIVLLVWIGVASSAIAVLVTHLWGWYVEELRLRTNHLSFRARTLPVSLNVWTAYLGAMVLFIGVAARQYRARLSRGAAGESKDALAGWQR
jgi:hypothetical protein